MGNVDRRLPGQAAVRGTAKLAGGARKEVRPKLVLEPVTWPAGLINRKPLLVASACPDKIGPGLAAVGRPPDVVTKCVPKAEIEKCSQLVRIQNGIAAENVIFENTWKRPRRAAIGCVSPTTLPKVGLNAVKLPPTNRHLVAVRRVYCNRRLIRSIADDVVAICIHVCLVTGKGPVPRDHSGDVSNRKSYAGGISYFSSCSFGFSCPVSAEAAAMGSKNREAKKDALETLPEFKLNNDM